MKYFLIVLIILIIPAFAYATHQNSQSTNCSISMSNEIIPILFINEERINPDGSFYAGDGFHYLFTFSGIEECLSFTALPILSEGIFDVISHNSIMWSSEIEKNHSHEDYTMEAKYLTTFHYYEIVGYSATYPHNHHCKCAIHMHTDPIFSDSPIFSYREDETLSDSSMVKINNFNKDTGKYLKTETQDWGFTNMDYIHEHEDYLHIKESDELITSFDNYVKSKCNNLVKYSGCVFGHVELDTEMINEKCMFDELSKMGVSHNIEEDFCVDVNHNLSLTVQGTRLSCGTDDKGNVSCKTVKVTNTQNINPNILPSEFEIILVDPPVKDRDNYDGKNKDGTYYPHDPIGIIHNPGVLWKDSRSETIQFVTTKVHDIKKEYEYDCNFNQCDHTLELNSVYPALYQFGNGNGITILNGTSYDTIGNHMIKYSGVMYNISREIGVGTGAINVELVPYEPKYSQNHPYPLLKDIQEYAFNDRQAVILHYLGSMQNDVIYSERRSLINEIYNVGVMLDSWNFNFISQNFTFSEGNTISDGTMESNEKNSMFVKEGYGKIYFDYPLRDIIVYNGMTKYYNVTSYTTLYSTNFAGIDSTLLDHFNMRYPETPFTKNITIKSINQNGDIINDKIELEIIPYENKSEYLDVYLYDKIMYDTSDSIFANVVSSDTNPTHDKINGTGILNGLIVKSFITMKNYNQYVNDSIETFDRDIVDKVQYGTTGDDMIYRVPTDVMLSLLTPQTFKVTVNDSITRNISTLYYKFGGNQTMTINTQNDNIIEVDRSIGFTKIKSIKNFGYIEKLYVNDKLVERSCKNGCTLFMLQPTELTVVAENIWGGTAYGVIPKEPQPIIYEFKEPNYEIITGMIIIGVISLAVYRLFIRGKI